MKPPYRLRLQRLASMGILFLAVFFATPSTSPSVPAPGTPPPTAEELAVLEELLAWIQGGPRAAGFRALSEPDILAAIRSRPRTFELFRSFNGASERRRLLESLPFGKLIGRAAERHSLDGLLLAAMVEAESGFDPEAVSPDGALGLMQVLPSTAGLYASGDFSDPAKNVEIGARYLSSLLKQFDGDLELALAAYNAGPGNVLRFDGVPPFRETQRYVRRVLSRYVEHHLSVWEQNGVTDWLL